MKFSSLEAAQKAGERFLSMFFVEESRFFLGFTMLPRFFRGFSQAFLMCFSFFVAVFLPYSAVFYVGVLPFFFDFFN